MIIYDLVRVHNNIYLHRSTNVAVFGGIVVFKFEGMNKR